MHLGNVEGMKAWMYPGSEVSGEMHLDSMCKSWVGNVSGQFSVGCVCVCVNANVSR